MKNPTTTAADLDPGNLADRIDETFVAVHADHRAIGGGRHVLPEDVARAEADLAYESLREARLARQEDVA